jgi:hypothetical protein
MMAVALLWICLGGPQDPPEFTRFEMTRTRIGNVVTAQAVVRNAASRELTDVQLTMVFFDHDQEIRRSKPAKIAKIAAGGTAPVTLEAERVPNFDRYQVIVEIGKERIVYYGRDPASPPSLKNEAPAKPEPTKLDVASMEETPPLNFPGEATLLLKVRNAGTVPAWEPTAIVSLRKPNGTAVKTARVRLADAIEARSEDTFELTLPQCPNYAAARVTTAWLQRRLVVPPGELTQARELELGSVKLSRFTDGTLRVNGKVRNGLPGPIGDVTLSFKFGSVAAPHALAGRMESQAVRDFEFFVPGCPDVEAYTVDYGYAPASEATAARAEPIPKVKRTDHRVLDASEEAVETEPERDP